MRRPRWFEITTPSMFEHALTVFTTADALPSTAVACVANVHGRMGGADPG